MTELVVRTSRPFFGGKGEGEQLVRVAAGALVQWSILEVPSLLSRVPEELIRQPGTISETKGRFCLRT